jgi:hypothetical protein
VNDPFDVHSRASRHHPRRRQQHVLDDNDRRREHEGVRSREDWLQRQHDAVIVMIVAGIEVGGVMTMRESMARRFVRVVREAAVMMGGAMPVNDQRWIAIPRRFGVHVLNRRQRQRSQAHGEKQGDPRAGQHHG